MPSFRTHDLRHVFGTRLAAMGVRLQRTQELMGLSSVQMVVRYAHPDETDPARAAIEELSRRQIQPPNSQDDGSWR